MKKKTDRPITAYIAETIFAESLRKYINATQLIAPKIGITGYNGTLNGLSICGSNFRNLIKDKFTKRYVKRLPKLTIDAIVSMLL